MSATLIKWILTAKKGVSALKTFDKHSDAARRAVNGKKPYPQSAQVEAQMAKLRSDAKVMTQIASNGIGKPAEELDWSGLAKMIQNLEGDEEQREEAARMFYAIHMPRLDFVQKGEELSQQLRLLSQEAARRRDAAVSIRNTFEKLTESFPDPTGSSIKVQLFSCYEAFEAASGALATVASAAADAMARVDKDLVPIRQKSKEFEQAFRTAYEASEKKGKAK
jgi:hypothetical protein